MVLSDWVLNKKGEGCTPFTFLQRNISPACFRSSLAALFCKLKITRKKEVPMDYAENFSTQWARLDMHLFFLG